MKKLGFGLMRLPLLDANDQSSIDIERTKEMVDRFMERGFTYFDTAYPYHGGASEGALRQAVVERYPRESFTVTTKMPCWSITCPADMERIFNEQLQRCGVEYFDYYWLHALNPDYTRIMDEHDGWGFIACKKAEGRIRHIGFSFHGDAPLLERLLTEHPEVEYVQLQINYLDWDSPAIQARTCYDICTRHGKPVIVMEPVRGGALARVPDSVRDLFATANPEASPSSWAIRYVASLPNVMVVLSGMSNLQQVDDNTGYMQDFKPLSDDEHHIVERVEQWAVALPFQAVQFDGGIACLEHLEIPIITQGEVLSRAAVVADIDVLKRSVASEPDAIGQAAVTQAHIAQLRGIAEGGDVAQVWVVVGDERVELRKIGQNQRVAAVAIVGNVQILQPSLGTDTIRPSAHAGIARKVQTLKRRYIIV